MKIQYASDLHLEFQENKVFLRKNPIKPAGDILLLAGDIVPFINIYEHSDFFDFVSDNFEATYWLPGNHEHYHSDIKDRYGYLNEKIRDNVFLVNNTSIGTGDVTFIFSTLWTRITARGQSEIRKRLSDFRVIRSGERLLTVELYNIIHDQCISFLKRDLSKVEKGRNIVITHHMPTFLNFPEEFKADVLNEAFAVELSELIETYQPDFWIFGHLHSNKNDFKIGKTRLVTKQLGYVMLNEQKGFNTGKIIEV